MPSTAHITNIAVRQALQARIYAYLCSTTSTHGLQGTLAYICLHYTCTYPLAIVPWLACSYCSWHLHCTLAYMVWHIFAHITHRHSWWHPYWHTLLALHTRWLACSDCCWHILTWIAHWHTHPHWHTLLALHNSWLAWSDCWHTQLQLHWHTLLTLHYGWYICISSLALYTWSHPQYMTSHEKGLFWDACTDRIDQSSISPSLVSKRELGVRLVTECIIQIASYIKHHQHINLHHAIHKANTLPVKSSISTQVCPFTFHTAVQATAVWGGIHHLSNFSQHITQTANTTQSSKWGSIQVACHRSQVCVHT